MNEYTYAILLDVKYDMWNWYDACNRTGFGIDWKGRVDMAITTRVAGRSKKEAYLFLEPYLTELYQNDKRLKAQRDFIERRFAEEFENACEKLVELTGRPLLRNNFTLYLTTFPRAPYQYETGSMAVVMSFINPIANFMHEVLHFQFIHYWRENEASKVAQLSDDDFEMLKESLTVILDESLVPLIERADRGYSIHKDFRKKLHIFWCKNRDFDALIDYGCSLINAE